MSDDLIQQTAEQSPDLVECLRGFCEDNQKKLKYLSPESQVFNTLIAFAKTLAEKTDLGDSVSFKIFTNSAPSLLSTTISLAEGKSTAQAILESILVKVVEVGSETLLASLGLEGLALAGAVVVVGYATGKEIDSLRGLNGTSMIICFSILIACCRDCLCLVKQE